MGCDKSYPIHIRALVYYSTYRFLCFSETLIPIFLRKFKQILSREKMTSWRHAISIASLLLCNAVTPSPSDPVAVPQHLGPGSLVLETPDGNETVSFNETWSPNVGSFIGCGGIYRTDLNVMSCQDAVNRIPDDFRKLRFGYDRHGVQADVRLPSRFISCEC